MTDLRKAAEMALDAMLSEYSTGGENKYSPWDVIEALRQALAQPDKPLRLSPVYEYGHIHEASQPEQEPVAWVKKLNTMIIGCADVINEDGVHEDAKKLAKLVKKDCYEILRSLEEKNGD